MGVQGQDRSLRSHSVFNILLMHIPFVSCQLILPFLRYSIFCFWKFDLENPRSSSWLRSTLKVTKWVRLPIDSHPFRSMSIGPHSWDTDFCKIRPWKSKVRSYPQILGMQLFETLTFTVQGQGHGWGQKSKSQSRSNSYPFASCQSVLPFMRDSFSKFYLWKSNIKVILQGDIVGRTYIDSTHMPFVWRWSTLPFQKYSFFKI